MLIPSCLGFIGVSNGDSVFFTITMLTVMLILIWEPNDKNTIDILRLTCHYFILVACLVQKPDNGCQLIRNM
jgi:hypothetical protein